MLWANIQKFCFLCLCLACFFYCAFFVWYEKFAQVGSLPLPSSLLPAATLTTATGTSTVGKGLVSATLQHHQQQQHYLSSGMTSAASSSPVNFPSTRTGGGANAGTPTGTTPVDSSHSLTGLSLSQQLTPLSFIETVTTPASVCPSPAPPSVVAAATAPTEYTGGQQLQQPQHNNIAYNTTATENFNSITIEQPAAGVQVVDECAIISNNNTAPPPIAATSSAINANVIIIPAVAEEENATIYTSSTAENIPQQASTEPSTALAQHQQQTVVVDPTQPVGVLPPPVMHNLSGVSSTEPQHLVDPSSATNLVIQQQIGSSDGTSTSGIFPPSETVLPVLPSGGGEENTVSTEDRTESSVSIDTHSIQESAGTTVESSPVTGVPPSLSAYVHVDSGSMQASVAATQLTTVTAPSGEQSVPLNVSFAVTSVVSSSVTSEDTTSVAPVACSQEDQTMTTGVVACAAVAAAASSAPTTNVTPSAAELEHSSTVDTNESPQVKTIIIE